MLAAGAWSLLACGTYVGPGVDKSLVLVLLRCPLYLPRLTLWFLSLIACAKKVAKFILTFLRTKHFPFRVSAIYKALINFAVRFVPSQPSGLFVWIGRTRLTVN